MARNHRVFIAFAMEDKWARENLVGQMRNANTPFAWTDMSVKNPWSSDWQNQCRSRIRGCDGMIAIVTRNTAQATGQLFEIRTAKAERIPLIGMYPTQDNRPTSLPTDLQGVRIIDWTWPHISSFLNSL